MACMTDRHARFLGTVPSFYDSCLGPFLFEPYALDLARRIAAAPAARVLELACGTGIATRRLREAIPAGAQIVATDLNRAMIELARVNLAGADVHWRIADACALPFRDAAFDAVTCQFGVMFFPDPERAFREARRVLRPGGRLLASVWCPLPDNPAAAIAHEVLARMFEDDPPQFLRVPYGSLNAGTLRALAIEAGFANVAVARVDLPGRAPSARVVATGFARGSPLSLDLADRGADLEAVARAFEEALAPHGGDPFVSPLAALVLDAS
jgi:SAM-dependent methyltransferase